MINKKPSITIGLLSRYYYHHLGYRKQRIISELNSFMEMHYPRYNPNDWVDVIEGYANRAGKYELCECNGVWVTENEIKTINSINNKVLERLAFTLLCLAKFLNFRNSNNNNWVNIDDGEIFRIANISISAFNKGIKFNELKHMGLIEYAKKINNLNIQVLYIDDNSEKVLFISDFRNLGSEWRLYCGENYIRCGECGKLFKKTSKNRKYCTDCVKENLYYNKLDKKTIFCVDCGIDIEVEASSRRIRCDKCETIERKRINRLNYSKTKKNQTSSF